MQAVDGGAVCVALANQHRYCMVNIQTGQVQIVFTPFIYFFLEQTQSCSQSPRYPCPVEQKIAKHSFAGRG